MISAAMNGLGRILGHYFPTLLFVPVAADWLLRGFLGSYFCTRVDVFHQVLFLLAQKTREGQLNPSQGRFGWGLLYLAPRQQRGLMKKVHVQGPLIIAEEPCRGLKMSCSAPEAAEEMQFEDGLPAAAQLQGLGCSFSSPRNEHCGFIWSSSMAKVDQRGGFPAQSIWW